jgi:hypothetical protein
VAELQAFGAHIPQLQPLDKLIQVSSETDRKFNVAMR